MTTKKTDVTLGIIVYLILIALVSIIIVRIDLQRAPKIDPKIITSDIAELLLSDKYNAAEMYEIHKAFNDNTNVYWSAKCVDGEFRYWTLQFNTPSMTVQEDFYYNDNGKWEIVKGV